MPKSHPNLRHVRYKDFKSTGEIDNELKRLNRILHMTGSLALRDVIREDQDFLLERRIKLVRKIKRGTRVPTT